MSYIVYIGNVTLQYCNIRVTAFEVKAACMGILISRELPYE